MKRSYNKLVRDHVPEIIQRQGKTCAFHVMDQEQYFDQLKNKLIEEGLEVRRARNKEEVAVELADILEVIEALKAALDIDDAEVQRLREKKAETNGRFEKRLLLEWVLEED